MCVTGGAGGGVALSKRMVRASRNSPSRHANPRTRFTPEARAADAAASEPHHSAAARGLSSFALEEAQALAAHEVTALIDRYDQVITL